MSEEQRNIVEEFVVAAQAEFGEKNAVISVRNNNASGNIKIKIPAAKKKAKQTGQPRQLPVRSIEVSFNHKADPLPGFADKNFTQLSITAEGGRTPDKSALFENLIKALQVQHGIEAHNTNKSQATFIIIDTEENFPEQFIQSLKKALQLG